MVSDQPIPYGQPTAFEIKKVEEKKKLDSGARIAKLGLVAPSGDKFWAELFVPANGQWPSEGKENFIIEQADNPQWLPKAKRPGGGGFGKKGGGNPRDPVEEAARQAMIIAQSARTAALEELRLAANAEAMTLNEIRRACDERVGEITRQALDLGDGERAAAKGRK